MTTRSILCTALSMLAVIAARAVAGPCAADLCASARHKAAGRYGKCVEDWMANGYRAPDQLRAGKCAARYDAGWRKLQSWSAVAGTPCASPRHEDRGATVRDRLTGLEWEKKTSFDGVPDPGNVHDADNLYGWSSGGSMPDGTVYTTFLRTLNAACFAGFCDWRLPTLAELLAIVEPAYPACTVPPCHAAVFGPTSISEDYWTASDHFSLPSSAWTLDAAEGVLGTEGKGVPLAVRAVRGGS